MKTTSVVCSRKATIHTPCCYVGRLWPAHAFEQTQFVGLQPERSIEPCLNIFGAKTRLNKSHKHTKQKDLSEGGCQTFSHMFTSIVPEGYCYGSRCWGTQAPSNLPHSKTLAADAGGTVSPSSGQRRKRTAELFLARLMSRD